MASSTTELWGLRTREGSWRKNGRVEPDNLIAEYFTFDSYKEAFAYVGASFHRVESYEPRQMKLGPKGNPLDA